MIEERLAAVVADNSDLNPLVLRKKLKETL
jgi:hypothetical protein